MIMRWRRLARRRDESLHHHGKYGVGSLVQLGQLIIATTCITCILFVGGDCWGRLHG